SQLAENSAEKARLAIQKSLPEYIKDLRKESISSLDAANQALADSLAADLYEQANLLNIEADELTKNADSRLKNTNNSSVNSNVYDDYEKGIKRYKESISLSEKARDLSLAQTQAIIDSTTDIETNLDLVEKYAKNDKSVLSNVKNLRGEYKSSIDTMESGRLREGFKKTEEIRNRSNELIASVILPYAKDRIKLATTKIEEAEKNINSEEKEENSPSINKDNLSAAKEAFNSSVDLLGKERYYDSIQQSDESIRLAEEILKSKTNTLANKSRATEEKSDKAIEDADARDSFPRKNKAKTTDPKADIKDGWKKYIVKKKVPPDTLWRIAANKEYLGNKDKWKEIYKANSKTISNPNKIYPNQVILIPPIQKKKK
ncbi:MAG TPA: LysM peptidoglycan-binding domain-containing protein, partial [Leptospiraceae bacterium]|nr:LysM peptidoglycan-binding domain-containing protein [Leptospiraceae bacterium]